LDGFSTFTCALSTGIDSKDNSLLNATLYPNPFTKEIKIKLKEKVDGELSVYNAVGQLIFTDKINADEYILNRNVMRTAGIYFVKVRSKNSEEQYKIVATD
jgi:hypothetical protein